MKHRIALATVLGMAISGTSVGGAPGWAPAPAASEPYGPVVIGTSEPSGTPVEGSVTLEVWFATESSVSGDEGRVATRTGLFRTTREQAATPAVGRAALAALLDGPTVGEVDAGVSTLLPAGTELLGLSIAEGVARVDLSGAFVQGADRDEMLMRLAQVVFTITQSSTVGRVDIRVDGASPVLEGLGIGLDEPQSRDDYLDQLPAILVERPLIGEPVSSPVTIAGTADVFEASVSIRILDAAGMEIAGTFTTATCGTGCRGDFSKDVGFAVAAEQPGAIEVFEASAMDGSPINLVRIPVTLLP